MLHVKPNGNPKGHPGGIRALSDDERCGRGDLALAAPITLTAVCADPSGVKTGGEGGIRTPGRLLHLRRFSKALLSTTQPPLRNRKLLRQLPHPPSASVISPKRRLLDRPQSRCWPLKTSPCRRLTTLPCAYSGAVSRIGCNANGVPLFSQSAERACSRWRLPRGRAEGLSTSGGEFVADGEVLDPIRAGLLPSAEAVAFLGLPGTTEAEQGVSIKGM
jgi:hypothetical protein